MKIRTKKLSYDKVMAIKPAVHEKPWKQWIVLRWLIWVLASVDLLRVRFSYRKIGMEKLDPKQPCLILMNHSCFPDMEIIGKIFKDRPYHIVCTLDALVGKKLLMKLLGCIATKKYITDLGLVRDMVYAVRTLKGNIVMFPEACYSFDGTATTLPDSLGKCLKMLQVPVVMVRTYGAFHRQPLYNGLRLRRVKVTADVEYILSPEEIKNKSADELNAILREQFSFDHFRWQQENKIRVKEKQRAADLNRVLYKCPHCLTEGRMLGKGILLTCQHCGKTYELTEYGSMKALEGDTEIDHIPDWYRWERECVRKEIIEETYRLDTPVDIYMMVDSRCIYQVGEGRLIHDSNGFHLTGCDGKLDYKQGAVATYTLNADYYWYEIGDVICVGDADRQYYCIPKTVEVSVAKTRLATEELYKLARKNGKNGEVSG